MTEPIRAMDPVSLVAAGVAFTQAIRAIPKIIDALRSLPHLNDALAALINEVSLRQRTLAGLVT